MIQIAVELSLMAVSVAVGFVTGDMWWEAERPIYMRAIEEADAECESWKKLYEIERARTTPLRCRYDQTDRRRGKSQRNDAALREDGNEYRGKT